MNNRDRVDAAIAVILAALAGGFAGRFFYASDLAQCRNRVYAAELTQEGSQLMMEECLDLRETLDVCELGQQAAEGIMDDLERGNERNSTILRAKVILLERRCPPDDSSKSGEP